MREKEYEIEEGDAITWYYVTRKKDGKTFSVERTHSPLFGITECTVYGTGDDEDEEIIPTNEEMKEIEDVISNHLEQKEEHTIKIEVRGGTIIDVKNLPEGTDYEVIDHDINEEGGQ